MPFGKPLASSRFAVLAALFLASAIAGCSSTENFEEPDPVPEVVSTVSLEPRWTVTVGDGHDGKYLHLSPIVVGGGLYAVSADGELVAIGPASGKVRWRRQLDKTIMAGVGGDSGQLYVVTENARLIALDRDDGEELWSLRMPNEVLAPPKSNGNVVVTQTVDSKVVAADARTGERLWQYDAPAPALSIRDTATPMVGSELALVSFSNGRVVALSMTNGQPVWQYVVGEPSGRTELERLVDVTAEPVIVEGAALVAGYQGKMALLNLSDGEEIWSRPVSTFNSPALGPNKVFVVEANGDVAGLDASNLDRVWTQDALSWRQLTTPIALGDYLVMGDFEGYLHILSQDDGQFEGQLKFDDAGLRVPIQRWEDRLIVYGNSGRLAVFSIKEKRD